jgi:PIN domain nuclease of toxin-antitoxin system
VETLYLDTHVIVWLFSGELEKLSAKAKELIEVSELRISPMVMLELEYLYEIGRITYRQDTILSSLSESIDLKLCDLSFVAVSRAATGLSWTRDPFDRMIVAHAVCTKSRLLSRDRHIAEHYHGAVW